MQFEEDVKIFLGYVHKFDYANEEEAAILHGHPLPGRVYRLIKDTSGYRLHIGKENNAAGLDGWMLGKRLKNTLRAYSFDVEIINAENYADLKFHPDDVSKMVTWLAHDNKDLLDYFNATAPKQLSTDMLSQLKTLLMITSGVSTLTQPITESVEVPSQPVETTGTIVLTNGTEIDIPPVATIDHDGTVFKIYFKNGSTCIYPMMHVLYIHQNN